MPDRFPRGVFAIAAAAAAVRALMVVGLELYSDEAYYWLWSRRPAFGYFDHPPMVAWLAGLSSALLPGEIGVRALFLVCGGLAVAFAGLAARELSPDPRAPVFAALLAASAPMLTLTGALALPDAPVEAAYAAAGWLIARARGRRWLGAGIAVGLALVSKYSAALLAPALVLLALWDKELRRDLRTRWPWAGAAVALAVFAPTLAWNAQHGFVSIRFQLGHGFTTNGTARAFAEYLGGQLLGPGPVACVLGISFLARARTSGEKRIAAMVLLPLAITTYAAVQGHVEANWPAFAYPLICAAGGAALARMGGRRGAQLASLSIAIGLALAGAFAMEEHSPRLLSPGSIAIERFHGWRETAQRAKAMARVACQTAGCDGLDPFIFPGSYQYAGELAYYAGWRRFGPAEERASQLDLWNETPPPGAPFLYVSWVPPDPDMRARVRADGEGPTFRFEVAHDGERLRAVAITPFARFLRLVRREIAGVR